MIQESDDARLSCDGSLNAQLQRTVSQRLGRTGRQCLRRIEVTVEDDRVVLSGTVPSFYLKQVAQETVRQACPDRRVYNELDVVRASGGGAGE